MPHAGGPCGGRLAPHRRGNRQAPQGEGRRPRHQHARRAFIRRDDRRRQGADGPSQSHHCPRRGLDLRGGSDQERPDRRGHERQQVRDEHHPLREAQDERRGAGLHLPQRLVAGRYARHDGRHQLGRESPRVGRAQAERPRLREEVRGQDAARTDHARRARAPRGNRRRCGVRSRRGGPDGEERQNPGQPFVRSARQGHPELRSEPGRPRSAHLRQRGQEERGGDQRGQARALRADTRCRDGRAGWRRLLLVLADLQALRRAPHHERTTA